MEQWRYRMRRLNIVIIATLILSISGAFAQTGTGLVYSPGPNLPFQFLPSSPVPNSTTGDFLCANGGVVGDCEGPTSLLALFPNAGKGSDDSAAINSAVTTVSAFAGELDFPPPASGAYNVCASPIVASSITLRGLGFQSIRVLPSCTSARVLQPPSPPRGRRPMG